MAITVAKLQAVAGIDTRGVEQGEKQVSGALGRMKSAFGDVGKIAGGILGAQVVGKIIGGAKQFAASIISSAADAETKEKQLDAVLASTGAAAAKRAAEYATASKQMVTSTALSGEELSKLDGSLKKATARLHDMERAYAKAKNPTESQTLALEEQRKTVAGLTGQIEKGGVKSTTTLANAMGLLPPVAQMTKKELLGLADSLSQVTPVEDDAIVAAESMLLTFTNIGKDVFPATTETLLDMATAMNSGAAPSAEQLSAQAIQLGKALNDPIKGITALTRVGVTFTEAQKDQIAAMVEAGDVAGAQKLILAELATEFGGSAKAAGDTFAGKLAILNNQMGNVKETIGGFLLPYLTKLAGKAIPLVTQSIGWLQAKLPNLETAIVGAFTKGREAIERFKQGQEFLGSTTGGAVNFLAALGVPADVTGEIYKRLLPVEQAIRTTFSKIKSAIGYFQSGLAQGSATKGLGWVLTQVIGLSPETANKLTSAIQPIETAIRNVWREIGDVVRDVMDGGIAVQDAAGYLLKLIGVPEDIAEAATDWISPIEIAIRGALKKLSDVVSKVKLGGEKGGIGGALGALFGELPDLGKAFDGIRKAVLDAAGKALGSLWATFAKAHPEIANPLEQIFGGATAKGGPDWTLMLGGLETLGTTLSDKLTPILKTAWDAAWKTISQVEIPFTGGLTIGDAFDAIKTKVEEIRAKAEETFGRIGEFVDTTLVPILAGLGATIAGLLPVLALWGIATLTKVVPALIAQAAATWAAIAPLLPIIAIAAAVGIAVGLLVAAWKNDWGGIRTFMTDLWTGTLQPLFNTVKQWFEVNIPAAIATVSGFWTNTLLPAIQGVWSWIETNLIPLFNSVGNLLSAVVGVAVTALAGLWENVLLPAIQSVGDWVSGTFVPTLEKVAGTINEGVGAAVEWLSGLWTDTLLPAIQSASAWFEEHITPALQTAGDTVNDALGPAIEWVTGLFGKADSSMGGLGATIQKITGWFNTLAEKVKNFKLPDVLTPGSPTPFEQGLVGVGDALVMVTDRFFAFATAVSPERAKAMKDVGSSLKDLAKAIGEVVGSMLSLNKTEGPGNAADIGAKFEAYLVQFETIGTAALEKVQQIWDEFGYKRIHKLKLTAGRIREIIEGVMVDLSGVTERKLPPLDVWFQQLRDVFAYSADMVASAIAKFGAKKLADMAQAAANIKAMYDVIWSGLADIKVNTDPEWRAAFVLLMDQLTFLGGLIVGWLGGFEQSVRNMIANAAETAVTVAQLWGVLINLDDKIKPSTSVTWQDDLILLLQQMMVAGGLIVVWLAAIKDEALEMVKRAAEAAPLVSQVFAILGVDLSKLVPPPPNFAALFVGFLAALMIAAQLAIPMLAQIRAAWGGEVLTEASETAGLLKNIIDVLTLGQVFADLAKPENAIGKNVGGLVTRILGALTSATSLLVPGLLAIKARWGEALETVKGVAVTMKEVIGGSADAYKSLHDFVSTPDVSLQALQAKLNKLYAAQAIMATTPTAPATTPATSNATLADGETTQTATQNGGLVEAIKQAIIEGLQGTTIELRVQQANGGYKILPLRLGELQQVLIDAGVQGSAQGVFG